MANYVTAATLKTFKIDGCVIDLTGYSDTEIEEAIVLAESIIESITNDRFYSSTETNLFDGNGKNVLFFAPRTSYQILTITSVKDLDIDGVTVIETLVENSDFVRYPHYLEVGKSWPGDTPRRGVFRGGTWPLGQNNIQVIGTWGRTTTPVEIIRATKLLAIETLKPGSTKMTRDDVTQAVWSDFTVTFKGNDLATGMGTGFLEVDKLLSRFINLVDMFVTTTTTPKTSIRR